MNKWWIKDQRFWFLPPTHKSLKNDKSFISDARVDLRNLKLLCDNEDEALN